MRHSRRFRRSSFGKTRVHHFANGIKDARSLNRPVVSVVGERVREFQVGDQVFVGTALSFDLTAVLRRESEARGERGIAAAPARKLCDGGSVRRPLYDRLVCAIRTWRCPLRREGVYSWRKRLSWASAIQPATIYIKRRSFARRKLRGPTRAHCPRHASAMESIHDKHNLWRSPIGTSLLVSVKRLRHIIRPAAVCGNFTLE